ncbi:MAG: DNA-binding protein [Chitinophagales bacterium]|nr:MAG: DNA-binding protein [Chitinophagales bacterium]
MDILKQYRIPFTGLKVGHHLFRFDITEEFFKAFSDAETGKKQVQVDVDFEKRENFFVVGFSIEGTVRVECDRCLETFDQPILDEFTVYVKYSDDLKLKKEEDEDIIYISRNDVYIDLSQMIYDFILLSIPVRRVCIPKEDGSPGCNEQVLKILENKQQKPFETDPRWAALKNLK